MALTEDDNDGTMPENVAALSEAVVGHRVMAVERNAVVPRTSTSYWGSENALRLTLDNGANVYLADTSDCCAYTELKDVIEHLPTMDHIVTSVRASDDYETWHIIADLGDVLELSVGWSPGNPFYYGYGFDISVVPNDA